MESQITETPIEQGIRELIANCVSDGVQLLGLDATHSTPEATVHAVDECVFKMQKGNGPELSQEELPQYLFGSLWGEQLVRKLGWSWVSITFHLYGDAKAIGVVSADRSLVIYPFHFIEDCLTDNIPVTIELAFNMLLDPKRIPPIPAGSYENVMDHVHHVVPRD